MSRSRSYSVTLGVALACACSLRSLDYLNEGGSEGNLHGTGGTIPDAGEGGEATTGGTSSGGSITGLVGASPPPADTFEVRRVQFQPGEIRVLVRNPQPEDLTIAVVTVDDAVVPSSSVER